MVGDSFERTNRNLFDFSGARLRLRVPTKRPSQLARRARPSLVLACRQDNDLLLALEAAGASPLRCDSAKDAVAAANAKAAVLILADNYPDQRTEIDPKLLDEAKAKGVSLFIEYPDALPGIEFCRASQRPLGTRDCSRGQAESRAACHASADHARLSVSASGG